VCGGRDGAERRRSRPRNRRHQAAAAGVMVVLGAEPLSSPTPMTIIRSRLTTAALQNACRRVFDCPM
jgi:hypothetical protein